MNLIFDSGILLSTLNVAKERLHEMIYEKGYAVHIGKFVENKKLVDDLLKYCRYATQISLTPEEFDRINNCTDVY